jgi:hypothetical protein
LAKGAISKEDLHVFLTTWVDRSKTTHLDKSHLAGGAWYLDCAAGFMPAFETELKRSREDVGDIGIKMLDLQAIEDENERAKAMKRRIEKD